MPEGELVARVRPRAGGETVAARIARLETELSTLRQQQRDEDDAQFLRAIVLAIGDVIFSVGDLRGHATVNPALAEALAGLRPKQLGKRLARVQGRTIDGLHVLRVKQDHAGWIWRIDFHRAAGVEARGGPD